MNTIPLRNTLTKKTHIIRTKRRMQVRIKKEMSASKYRTCVHKLDTSASLVYIGQAFCFSILDS